MSPGSRQNLLLPPLNARPTYNDVVMGEDLDFVEVHQHPVGQYSYEPVDEVFEQDRLRRRTEELSRLRKP